jgi:hypothetical protein
MGGRGAAMGGASRAQRRLLRLGSAPAVLGAPLPRAPQRAPKCPCTPYNHSPPLHVAQPRTIAKRRAAGFRSREGASPSIYHSDRTPRARAHAAAGPPQAATTSAPSPQDPPAGEAPAAAPSPAERALHRGRRQGRHAAPLEPRRRSSLEAHRARRGAAGRGRAAAGPPVAQPHLQPASLLPLQPPGLRVRFGAAAGGSLPHRDALEWGAARATGARWGRAARSRRAAGRPARPCRDRCGPRRTSRCPSPSPGPRPPAGRLPPAAQPLRAACRRGAAVRERHGAGAWLRPCSRRRCSQLPLASGSTSQSPPASPPRPARPPYPR